MNGGNESRATAAVLFLAALWPLGVYTQLPWLPFQLNHLAVLAVGLYALARWRAHRKLRPPFEYWWPPVVALLVAATPIARSGAGFGLVGLHALFFLGPIVLVQGRQSAALACLALAGGGALVAVLSAAAQLGIQPPTAIAIEQGIALAGPADLRHGALLVFHAVLAGIFASFHPELSINARRVSAIASALSGIWLATLVSPAVASLARPAQLGALLVENPAGGLIALLALWLAARVAARASLRAPSASAPPRGLAPVLILLGAGACVCWGAAPGPGALLLLGFLAAHEAPWVGGDRVNIPVRLWAPVVACVTVQVLGVIPFAPADPRNQAARSEAFLTRADWPRLDGTLDFLLARHPGDPAYTMLRARSLASQGWPEAAAAAFCSTTYPEDDLARYGVSFSAHRRALLDSLRDQASGLSGGDRGLFFERALVHAGEVDNALRFLALQDGDLFQKAPADGEVSARALALLLGDPGLAQRLAAGGDGDPAALLSSIGVHVGGLPADFPQGAGPLLLRAVAGPQGVAIDAWPGLEPARHISSWTEFAGPAPETLRGGPLAWSGWTGGAGGAWELPLLLPPHPVATVLVGGGGLIGAESSLPISPPQSGSAALALYIP